MELAVEQYRVENEPYYLPVAQEVELLKPLMPELCRYHGKSSGISGFKKLDFLRDW